MPDHAAIFGKCLLPLLALLAGIATAHAETPVERGSYLVNTIMTCHNCHTPIGPTGPQFDKALSGGLTFNTPGFLVTAPNITPDRETGIGAYTDEQLKQELRTGVRPNGIPLAGVMPTAYYGIISDSDMTAIVAYLRSVKPIHNEVTPPVYKVAVVHEIYPGAEQPMQDQGGADPVRRGFYLSTIGHCAECHTPMERGMHLFATQLAAGKQQFPGPWGVSTSRNITSDPKYGVGAWSDAELKTAITQGISRDGSKLKPPMGYPLYSHVTDADMAAVIAWVRTLPAKN